MMFQTIQTIYFLWGYDPGNLSASFIAELSPVYCCLVRTRFVHLIWRKSFDPENGNLSVIGFSVGIMCGIIQWHWQCVQISNINWSGEMFHVHCTALLLSKSRGVDLESKAMLLDFLSQLGLKYYSLKSAQEMFHLHCSLQHPSENWAILHRISSAEWWVSTEQEHVSKAMWLDYESQLR